MLPVWRDMDEPRSGARAAIGMIAAFVALLVVARMVSAIAILTFIGSWGATLGAMRLVTGRV